jgi:hypothetical protein
VSTLDLPAKTWIDIKDELNIELQNTQKLHRCAYSRLNWFQWTSLMLSPSQVMRTQQTMFSFYKPYPLSITNGVLHGTKHSWMRWVANEKLEKIWFDMVCIPAGFGALLVLSMCVCISVIMPIPKFNISTYLNHVLPSSKLTVRPWTSPIFNGN